MPHALTDAELENLEKKYFEIICGILSNNIGRFVNEICSQANTPGSSETDKKNPIESAAENIMNAMIARRLDWGISSVPGASDSCYECGDAIVHIDAKTILNTDPDVGGNSISLRQNQTSFDFDTPYELTKKRGDRSGGVFIWKPNLHRYENHRNFGVVPNLTYILEIIWSAKNLVEQISVISIPNGQLFKTHNSILGNVKSYPRGKELENIRFKIGELTRLDPWRENIVYKHHS
jgi:hypothetical protein